MFMSVLIVSLFLVLALIHKFIVIVTAVSIIVSVIAAGSASNTAQPTATLLE